MAAGDKEGCCCCGDLVTCCSRHHAGPRICLEIPLVSLLSPRWPPHLVTAQPCVQAGVC